MIQNANDAMLDMSKITTCGYTYRNNKTSASKCNLNANRAISDSSRGTTLGHAYIETAKPPQRSGQHIVPPDCFKGISPLWDQMKIQMQTKQYHIRTKAQPENTHVQITKPA